MYFPYLRGRQNELIALRELIINDRLSEKIIPIVEPVKVTSTLINTIHAFVEKDRHIIIVTNPTVGSFATDLNLDKNAKLKEKFRTEVYNDSVLFGIIVDNRCSEYVSMLCEKGIPFNRMVTICLSRENIEYFLSAFSSNSPIYNVIPYSAAFRRVRKGDRVMIDDKFNKLARNNDYLSCDDEFFSDDHLYYSDDNYVGFSDYSIVGKEYFESGFAPYAVAIHIVYPTDPFANVGKPLRIHHFVSDSNQDISDPANKFYEALSKLIEWNLTKGLCTLAIEKFNEMYDNQSYPGLGVIKRLSIMHHIEIVDQLLNNTEE